MAVPHVVIIGAGFAGISAARALRKAPVRVTLVDRRVYNTFQPLLYQVATGGLNPGAGRVRLALVADEAECLEAAQRIVSFTRTFSAP